MVVPRKNPMKRVVKEQIKVPNNDIKDENRYYFTDKILKIAYDIKIDNHHDENGISQLITTSNFYNLGVDMNHINEFLKEMDHVYGKSINPKKFKNQVTFLV